MMVMIAGMQVALESCSSGVMREVEAACSFFTADPGRPPLPTDVRIVCSSRESGDSSQVRLRADAGSYRADTPEFSTVVDLALGTGTICFSSCSPGSFTRALKNLAYYLVLAQGGVLLHASGVVKDGEAYIFLGPSGSGKSTVCRLSHGCAVLSQECLGILRNKSGNAAVWGLPYADDAEFQTRVSSCGRIAALVLLVQDEKVFARRLSKREALPHVTPAPHEDFQTLCDARKILSVMDALLDEVPCYELHFRRDPSFWKEIEAKVKSEKQKVKRVGENGRADTEKISVS